jgi:hypothetical protein
MNNQLAESIISHLSDDLLSQHYKKQKRLITARQFETPVPHEQARGTGFLTKLPSKRARILMGRILNE